MKSTEQVISDINAILEEDSPPPDDEEVRGAPTLRIDPRQVQPTLFPVDNFLPSVVTLTIQEFVEMLRTNPDKAVQGGDWWVSCREIAGVGMLGMVSVELSPQDNLIITTSTLILGEDLHVELVNASGNSSLSWTINGASRPTYAWLWIR